MNTPQTADQINAPIIGKVETVERTVDYHQPLKQCQRVEWAVYPCPPRVSLSICNEVYQMPDEVLERLVDAYAKHMVRMHRPLPLITNTEEKPQ